MTSNSRHGLPPRLMAHQPTRFATAQESKPSPSPGIRMTDREAQAPERDVVGDVRRAHGPEQDGVEVAELVGAILRHHDTVLFVVVGPPIEVLEIQLEAAVAFGADLERLDAGINDFRSDAVASHSSDTGRAAERATPGVAR